MLSDGSLPGKSHCVGTLERGFRQFSVCHRSSAAFCQRSRSNGTFSSVALVTLIGAINPVERSCMELFAMNR